MTNKTDSCPIETTLNLVGERWKILILRDLMDGTKRFGELRKSIGTITQKVLTTNLRSMEEYGLLKRKIYAEVPPRVEYTLTKVGHSLKPVLDAMIRWGFTYNSSALRGVKKTLGIIEKKKKTSDSKIESWLFWLVSPLSYALIAI